MLSNNIFILLLLLLLLLLFIAFMQGIYNLQTMFLGCIVLQLCCIYSLWYM